MQEIKPRYYTIKQIKILEGCGKDAAYELANKLAHEKRGKQIFVFAEAYEEYYKNKKEKAMNNIAKKSSNEYQMRRFS